MKKIFKLVIDEYLLLAGLILGFVLGLIYMGIDTDPVCVLLWFLYIPFALILYWRYRMKKTVSFIYCVYMFICAGIDPAFFFKLWDSNGIGVFSGIGNFKFGIQDFFVSYGYAVFLMIIILLTIILCEKYSALWSKKNIISKGFTINLPFYFHASEKCRKLIFCFVMPILFVTVTILNYLMLKYRIGISGIPSRSLPFRMVGIMYYSRLYIVPVILIALYYLSKFDKRVYIITILLAMECSLASGSRLIGLLYLMPLLFVDLGRKNKCWVFTVLIAYICFLFANNSRTYIYTSIVNKEEYTTLTTILPAITVSFSQSIRVIPNHIKGIGDRLFGCQCYILASQFSLETGVIDNVKNFFENWNGAYSFGLVNDKLLQLFDINSLPEGLGAAVGLGLIASLLVVAEYKLIWIVLCGMVIGILLGAISFLNEIFISLLPKGESLWKALIFLVMFRVWGGEIIYIRHFVFVNLVLILLMLIIKRTINKGGD